MGMSYYYYVGAFVKTNRIKNLSDILENDTLIEGRGEIDRDSEFTYLIPNVKIKGIERKPTYDKYGDNLEVQSFEPEDISKEIELFYRQFANELIKLREITKYTVEWGVVPSFI